MTIKNIQINTKQVYGKVSERDPKSKTSRFTNRRLHSGLNDITKFDWEMVHSPAGCKAAYCTLKDRLMEQSKSRDVEDFLTSRRYKIAMTKYHRTIEDLISTFESLNLQEHTKHNSSMCLILEPGNTYVFFWRKLFFNSEMR